MPKEIERKFLVRQGAEFEPFQSTHIKQGYLNSSPERTVRVRIRGDKAYLTVKGLTNDSGTTRYEWEKEITTGEAVQLLSLCEKGVIDKVRHLVANTDGVHTWEIDEFAGDNAGLTVAEIELANEYEEFDKPDWLGKEVTGDSRYYNSSLSLNPYNTWPDRKYSYLIFDFDGTLADTNKGIVDTYQETFRRMNFPVPSREDISATIGLSLRDGFLGTRGGMTLEESEQAVKIYRAIFPEIAFPVITAFPGVVETLKTLRQRGYRMSIATSRSHCTLEYLARQIGVADFFDGLYGAEDVANHKPAPDLVNLIVDKYGLDKKEVLVIGDASFDIQMGHGAGCDVCAVSWGNQSKEQLAVHCPENLIDLPAELLNIL